MTDDESELDNLYIKLLSTAEKYGFNEDLIETRSYKQIYLECMAK